MAENKPPDVRDPSIIRKRDKIKRHVGEAVDLYGYILLFIIGGFTLAVGILIGFKLLPFTGTIVLLCGASSVLITFIINRNRPLLSEQEKNINELKKQNGDLLRNQQDLESELDRMGELLEQTLRTTLMNIFSRLDFTGDERISLFLVNNDDNSYTIISRYTSNTAYTNMKRPKKTVFKPFLDKVFSETNGELLIGDLPEYIDNQPHVYLHCLRDDHDLPFGVSDIKNLRMKPRNIYLNSITDGGNRCGIVVFESRQSSVLTVKKQEIIMILEQEKQLLVEFIRHKKSKKPVT
jgi:hypothetical protein